MLGVVESGVVAVLISTPLPEPFAAGSANIKPRQPACQPDGPEGVIAERQGPTRTALDFASGEQDQPEHGLVDLVFRKDPLGDFADQGEADAELVVALRLVKRTEQIGLLDPHEVARFPFEIPDPHVGQKFECRAVAVFQAARAGGYTTHASRATTEKTNQAIGLAERKGLQDDGFRFAGRHALSARRHFEEGDSGPPRKSRARAEPNYLPHAGNAWQCLRALRCAGEKQARWLLARPETRERRRADRGTRWCTAAPNLPALPGAGRRNTRSADRPPWRDSHARNPSWCRHSERFTARGPCDSTSPPRAKNALGITSCRSCGRRFECRRRGVNRGDDTERERDGLQKREGCEKRLCFGRDLKGARFC